MKKTEAYPPFDSGYIDVTHGHRLYFERYGNPKGIPLLYLHGGPGGGFDEDDKRYFEKGKWNVLLFDQRGAGRSTPFASTEGNTTQLLIDDIEVLLKKFGMKKVVLFGGSWGSTLALSFAIAHPERVAGMILRGIFLNTRQEHQYIYQNARYFRPAVWERFMSHVPVERRNDVVGFYQEKLASQDEEVRKKYAYEWSLYELSLLSLRHDEKKVKKILSKGDLYVSLAALEIHYFAHDCFLPENHILDNLESIQNIPTTIVHGMYDLVCPPRSAYLLHSHLKQSSLHMTLAGHSGSDKATEKALIKALEEWESNGVYAKESNVR